MMKLTPVAITFVAGLATTVPAVAADAGAVQTLKAAYLIQLGTTGEISDTRVFSTAMLDKVMICLADTPVATDLGLSATGEWEPARPANRGHVAF